MSIFSTETRYGSPAQLLHWLTAILVLFAFIVAEGGPPSRVYGAANAANLQLHETLGLSVFVLVLVRLVWRSFDRTPADPPMPGWMALASRVSHWALYALLLLVPLTALLGTQFAGHAVTTYFGTFGPVFQSWQGGAELAEIHGTLGDAIIWLAGLHAAAAIYHHVVLRDRVLKTMLPGNS
ncbi:cytochrome b [soil metagenome]